MTFPLSDIHRKAMSAKDVRDATEEEVSMELRRMAALFIPIVEDETLTDEELMNKIREAIMSSHINFDPLFENNKNEKEE